MMVVGDGYVWHLKKLLRWNRRIAFYHFARIFEGVGSLPKESGVHLHITDIEFASEQWDESLASYTTPVAARIEITLEEYDRLRRCGGEEDPFTSYTKVGSGAG